MSQVDRENAEPLLVSAVLLVHLNWLYSHSEEAELRGFDLSTFRMCQGASFLAQKASPWTAEYDFLSNLVLKTKLEDEEIPEYDEEFVARVREDMDALLQAVDDGDINAQQKNVYEGAAEDVLNTASLFASGLYESGALEQQIVTVLHRVPPPFIKLLERQDPVAMAIMARNIAFLGIFNDTSAWWLHGCGKNNVSEKAVRAIAIQMPPEYMWTMDFPYKLLSKEIKVV